MARRTKAEKFDVEVEAELEAALEAALDFNFDDFAGAEGKAAAGGRDSAAGAGAPGGGANAGAEADFSAAAAEGGGSAPSFSEAFFSFRDLSHEEEEAADAAGLEEDIFDLKSLEQQIVSAAEELNRADAGKKNAPAEPVGNAAETAETAPEPEEFGAAIGALTGGVAAAEAGKDGKKRKYIIVGGKIPARPGARQAEAAEGEAGQAAAPARTAAEPPAEGGSALPYYDPDQEDRQNLARFLEEQNAQPAGADKAGRAGSPLSGGSNAAGGDSGGAFRNGEPPAPAGGRNAEKRAFGNPLYWTTAAVSALWVAGGIVTGWRLASESGVAAGSFLASAQGLLVAAGTIVPVFMFWGFAQLSSRARELQKIVQTMTGAAMRLLEPESASSERISTLGRTIRQEVQAMDAGIDRTMSRASELEALLQSEVSNLERSYGENEARIRALIAELANEREAVATHADNVKSKITGAKDQLTREFSSIADHINATAESFTIALSETLNSRWGELVNEFNTANEEVARQLSQKFIDTVQSFDASRGQFFEELDTRFSQIDAHTEAASQAVAERLGNKMDDFVRIVQERTEEVEGRFDVLSGRLAESGSKVIDSVNGSVNVIEQRTEHIEERLQSTADKVLGDFDKKFQQLDDAIIDRSNRSLNDFSEQIDRLEGRTQDFPILFDEAARNASDAFNKQMDMTEERGRALAGRLSRNGVEIAETILHNMEQAEKRAGEMDSRLKLSSQAVREVFEDKLNAMDALFIDRSNNSLRQFAAEVQKLENKSESLSAEFDGAIKVAMGHFEERLSAVDNLLSHKSTSLINSFIEKTESLEESTEKLNTALEVHIERVNEAFSSRASDITQSLANGRNDILSIVDETKTRLSHEMEIVGTTIGKLVDERAGGFIYQFIEGREKLSRTLQEETGRIIGTVSDQMARLSRYVADIEKNLLSRVEDVESHARAHVDVLSVKTDEFEKSLTDSFGLTRQLIETQAQNIDARSQSLRESLSSNSEELNAVLGEQAAALEERIAAIRRIVADSDSAFTEAMRDHVAAFGKSVSAGDAELREIFLTHLKNLENQTGLLKERFTEGHAALAQSLDGKLASLQSLFGEGRESLETLLDKHGNVISERAVRLQENLAQTLTSIDDKLNKQGELLDKRAYDLRDAVDYNSTVLSDSFLRQTAIIDERAKTMEKTLELGVSHVRETIEENSAALSEALRQRLADVSGTLQEETRKTDGIIAAAADKLLSSVYNAADNADQKLAARGEAISDVVGGAGERLSVDMAGMEARMANIAASLSAEADKAGALIEDAGGRLSQAVAQSAGQADKVFADRSGALQNNLEMVEGRLNYSLQAIQQQMLASAGEAEQRLEGKSQEFRENLQQMRDEIGGGVDGIRERIAELTHNATQELVEKTDSLYSLTEQLKNAATRTSDSLANLTGTFSKQLHEVTQAAEERLRQENDNFISAFSGRTEDAVFAVKTAKGELETQVTRLLEGLENSGSSIQLTMSNLHGNVEEVDKKLSGLTSEFKQNVGELSESFASSGEMLSRDLQRFNDQSREAAENIAKFSDQFNAHAGLLSEASHILENSNTVFADKIADNQESLNRLAQGLVAKSDEIAEAMRNCEQIISSVIKTVEERTWSSSAELRSSLSALINEAAGRFEGATEEIRKAADDIRGELNRTKADLDRGLSGLPLQTKEYTDAMRKAVMDQVEALKDLSGIVEESGLMFDVSRPRSAASAPAARASGIRPTASSARPASSMGAELNGGGYNDGFTRSASSPYAAPQPANGAAAAGGRDGQTRGWVSDLLARASKEEQPVRQPPAGASVSPNGVSPRADRSGASLNSMSADIVQAIDREGIAKLWQHYRRGQRNIAPDQLYTPEGYRIFEDIKQKYAYDGEFRRAVGQYISDFEHLLGDVTKNGGNNGTVRDYLTSDTGKVYTMLAHVSGRIQ